MRWRFTFLLDMFFFKNSCAISGVIFSDLISIFEYLECFFHWLHSLAKPGFLKHVPTWRVFIERCFDSGNAAIFGGYIAVCLAQVLPIIFAQVAPTFAAVVPFIEVLPCLIWRHCVLHGAK